MDGVILWISNLVGNNYLSTVLMSFVPLIELKGGIIFARGTGLGFFIAFLLAYVGSCLAFFPVYFLLKPILKALKKTRVFSGLATKIENYFNSRAEKAELENLNGKKKIKSQKFLKQLSVFIFVAIPLPMTGVYTGTAIAVFLGLSFKDSILPVLLGNIVAGLIISALAEIFIAVWSIACLDYVLWGLFGLALIILIITIIKVFKGKKGGESK